MTGSLGGTKVEIMADSRCLHRPLPNEICVVRHAWTIREERMLIGGTWKDGPLNAEVAWIEGTIGIDERVVAEREVVVWMRHLVGHTRTRGKEGLTRVMGVDFKGIYMAGYPMHGWRAGFNDGIAYGAI